MKTYILFVFFLSFCWCSSFAQEISLVKDMNPGASGTAINGFTEAGGMLFFAESPGYNYTNNSHLWKTDGTENGTILLFYGFNITALTSFNNQLYFVASDSINGGELWKTDGTAAGTQMVKDINPGSGSAFSFSSYFPIALKEMNQKLYFCASDGVHGQELWVTDGTTQGTHMVIDLNPVSNPTTPDGVFNVFEVVGNKIFFDGYDGNEYGIWMTDGTAGGTSHLKKMQDAINFCSFNNRLCYTDVDSGSSLADLWITDGTTNGTTKLYQGIFLNISSQTISDNVVLNNRLFFYSETTRSLFVTDGTVTGTIKLKDSLDYYSATPAVFQKKICLTPYNSKLFFSATGTNNTNPGELWETDGTSQGTKVAVNLPSYNASSNPIDLLVANSKLFFRAHDTDRVDVWVSDGTATGTYKITDPNCDYHGGAGPIATSRDLPGEMYYYNNMLIYGNKYYDAVGQELYKLELPLNVSGSVGHSPEPSLYPNPTTGSFTIDLKNNNYTTLSVLNQLGQTVYTQPLNPKQGKQQIELKNMANGLYFIKLSGKYKNASWRIVIER